ncbi:MAG TPA: amidohydrolase, partial [Terrimesophilobacter sp.]|nr:amidohydrolase [Terrimesophilobacter sp.]
MFALDRMWFGGRVQPLVFEADADGIRLAPDGATPDGRLVGTALPGFRDVHVHLGLVDPSTLLANGIATVIDCGWIPDVAATWIGDPRLPEVRISGAFLTCPGGYPSDREWAPPGSVREVTARDAAAAVDEQLAHGAEFIKVVL